MFKYVRENVPNIDKAILSWHGQYDIEIAVANSIEVDEIEAEKIEGTINGIGERAGNVSLEELVVAFHIRSDFYPFTTNITLNEIKRTSDLVSKLTGMHIQANKAIVGKNAFAHESGIHQDGVL